MKGWKCLFSLMLYWSCQYPLKNASILGQKTILNVYKVLTREVFKSLFSLHSMKSLPQEFNVRR